MLYETVIGLEVHVELDTASKIFCACSTRFGAQPNTQCCPVCAGLPGVLPVLNKKAVEYAMKAGLALNCKISSRSLLDRKNYFYPDLPKAYQISQLYHPLCTDGYLLIGNNNDEKKVRIREIHIEEDAGKLVHDEYGRGTLVDYNRCGVPLIEIVTQPDLASPDETREFLMALKSILEYTGVSDCRMQEGSMRADVNISIREKGSSILGTRTEMKNLNSFRAITRAIENETVRQRKLLEEGISITQETRRWDDDRGISYSMRSKEEAHDYRYFPEPDILPIVPDAAWVAEIAASIPILPALKAKRYSETYGLSPYDSGQITASKTMSEFFDSALLHGAEAKTAANWLSGEYMKLFNASNNSEYIFRFTPEAFAQLLSKIADGTITGRIAKDIFRIMYETGSGPDEIIIKEGISVMSDESELEAIVIKILNDNPKSVEDYRNGKTKAIGFLTGQLMKATSGKADPQKAGILLLKKLENKPEAK